MTAKWEKYALIVSVLGLVFSIISLAFSAGLTYYSLDLARQSNNIAQKSLDLQNYKPLIIPSTNRIYLENGWSPSQINQLSAQSSGLFNFSVTVLSPNGGILSIEIENFTVSDYSGYLKIDKLNMTELGTDNYGYSNHDQLIVQGLNQKDFSIPLRVSFYPDYEKMEQQGLKGDQYLPIGIIYLKATFTDISNNVTPKAFSEVIIARTIVQNGNGSL